MSGKLGLIAVMILGSLSSISRGEGDSVNEVVLYQVGKQGNYCLSITPNESGCVSGTSSDGDTVNLMEFVKGKSVVFRNLSDAPHDMKFSGANAEDMPPQAPQAADAVKRFNAEDLIKNKISCSFHGAQLAVGYKVAGQTGQGAQNGADGDGHKEGAADGPKAPGEGQAGSVALGAAGGVEGANGTGGGNLKITGLADVSREVLAKGSANDVAKLVAARPELMSQLKEMRPLLAAEIAPKIASAGGLAKGLSLGGLNGPGAPKGANGLPTGAGVQGFTGGGTKIAGAGGPQFGIIREDLTGGENSNDDDWQPGERPKSKRIQLPGGATLVLNKRMAPGGVEKKNGQRGLASADSGDASNFRTQLKPVAPRGRGGWIHILKDGHTWIIVALLLAVGMTAKFAIAGTRKARGTR